jgi:hypothetical protein
VRGLQQLLALLLVRPADRLHRFDLEGLNDGLEFNIAIVSPPLQKRQGPMRDSAPWGCACKDGQQAARRRQPIDASAVATAADRQ